MKDALPFWAVFAAAALVLLLRSGAAPLTDPDEARFARTSVEMLESGDPVVPRFGGVPRLVKPPLIHWIQSSVFSLVGPSEWAARLHAALATLGTILLVGWVGHRRFGPEGGTWAAAMTATMPLVFVLGRVGTIDALLAVHVLAVVALDLAGPSESSTSRSVCTGALLGLAFLAKGPVGVVLPLLMMLAGRTAVRRDLLPSPLSTLQALAAGLAVVLPWALAFVRRVGWSTAYATLRAEGVERHLAADAHVEPPWYYLQVAAVAFLPWLTPLIVGSVRAWRNRREAGAHTALYAGAAFVAGLAFFSLGRGKLPSYVLPLAPLVALVATWELAREVEAPRERTAGPTLLAATLIVLATLLGLAGALGLRDEPRVTALAGAGVFASGAIVACWAVVSRRTRGVYAAAAASTAVFYLVATTVLFPGLGRARSAGPLVEAVPALTEPRPLATVEIKVPSLTFYLGRPPEVLEWDDLPAWLAAADRPLVVFADADIPDVPEEISETLEPVGNHGKYSVFERVRTRREQPHAPGGADGGGLDAPDPSH